MNPKEEMKRISRRMYNVSEGILDTTLSINEGDGETLKQFLLASLSLLYEDMEKIKKVIDSEIPWKRDEPEG